MYTIENETDTPREKGIKTYKSKTTIRTKTSFNRKLERTVPLKGTYNKKQNKFYTNHYPIRVDNVDNEDLKTLPMQHKFNNKLNPRGVNNNNFLTNEHKNDKFCINCGIYGHTKGQCYEPNISNGVISVRYNLIKKVYEFFIIMRKHSHGYCDLIRGKYPEDKQHIKRLLEETTIEERFYLLNKTFMENWIYLWGENNSILKRFMNTQIIENKFNTLKKNAFEELITAIKSTWTEPEWGFPKGQRDGYEKNIDTAFREFSEESGYSRESCLCVSNLSPIQEIFIGSNNKKYKQLYYLSFMNYEDTVGKINYQENEIGDACWASFEELLEKFRYYDKEKIQLAKTVQTILKNNYFVYI